MPTRGVAPQEVGHPRSTVQVSRTIPGPRERVFRAWTDPDEVSRWFGGPLGYAASGEADVRPGGAYRINIEFNGRLLPPVAAVGKYLEVEPPERLVYTFAWESEASITRTLGRALDLPPVDGESRVTVEFLDRNGSTEVRVTHELLETRRNRAFHNVGWHSSLRRLDALLSGAR